MNVVARPEPAAPARPAVAPSTRATLRAVIRRGLRDHRRTALAWGVPLGAMSALMAAIWPSIEGSMDELMRQLSARAQRGVQHPRDDDRRGVHRRRDAELHRAAGAGLPGRARDRPARSGAEERGYLDIVLTAPVARRTLVAGAVTVAAIVVAVVLASCWR